MKCLFCKKDIEPTMKYCPHCGKSALDNAPLSAYMGDTTDVPAADIKANATSDPSVAQTVAFDIHSVSSPSSAASPLPASAAAANLTAPEFPKIFNPDTANEALQKAASSPQTETAHPVGSSPQSQIHPTPPPAVSAQGVASLVEESSPFAAALKADELTGTNSVARADIDTQNNVLHYSEFDKVDSVQFTPPPPPTKGVKTASGNGGNHRRKIILSIVAIAIVLIAAALAYFYFGSSRASVTQTTKTIEAGTDVDMLTLIDVKERENYDIVVKTNEVDVKKLGSYKVVYTITAKKNQRGRDYEFLFTVQDTTPPQINAPDNIAVLKDQKLNVMDGITITDNLDGTIDPSTVIMSGSPDTSKTGTYPITLTVADKAGNKATKELSVIVEDKSNPVTFFNQIAYNWEFLDNMEQMMVIKKEDNKYLLFIGYKESEGYGGSFVLNTISPDNKTATGTWMFSDEDGDKQIPLKFDLGTSGDGKMKVDYGDGWHDVQIYKGN